jgi:hypothetical protein
VTYVSSELSPALRERPIEDVPIDWERFVPRLSPIDLVVVRQRPHVGAGMDPEHEISPARRDEGMNR